MSKNNLAALPPFVQGRSIENSRWYMGNVMTFLVNSEQTDGAFSMTSTCQSQGTNLLRTSTIAKMSLSTYWRAASMPTSAKRSFLRA
jgi:hypothetical protein